MNTSRLRVVAERIDARGRVRTVWAAEDTRPRPAAHATLAELRAAIRDFHFQMCPLSAYTRTPPCITQIVAEGGDDLVADRGAYARLPRHSRLRVRLMVHAPVAHPWRLSGPLEPTQSRAGGRG